MSGRSRDLIIGFGSAMFFAVVLLAVIPYQIRVPSRITVAALSPAFWPTTVAIAGILLGLVIAFRGLANLSENDDDDSPAATAGERQEWRCIAAIALMFGYLALIHLIGIVAASVLAILALACLFSERRLTLLAPVAVILPVGLYYFFTKIAYVPLPLGVFEQLF
ncbi:MAG: tripartite tricarboxylate transporter TctB family protein [Aquisalimonadaceae bacterium]